MHKKSDDLKSDHTLLYQTHSPFARKVLVFALECGLGDRIEVVHHETSPTNRNAAVFAANPLGKVPVLILPDGMTLYDSMVICDYLDRLHSGRKLIPHKAPKRWHALRLHALAQGMCDAGVLYRWETNRRPQELRYPPLADGQKAKLIETFDHLETALDPKTPVTIGHIALATGLDWIAFRELIDFKTGRPALSKWYEDFCARDSMVRTRFSGQTHD
ncbi:glutathione S-transferase family protein [Thalassospira lucentensis]|uniref:Glutathione S-transferase n=1 Tax=Thalassospira lucentensis TaxID=168935 RepID=A0A358HQ22_9PROT|nr:glutathione S-transferase [Thalassospira lucentensis]HBU97251.1 glutathione S-transferase [Thalassospira lucentensis]HCW67695.1 glutathione S-transferase [Thalassospira lucentensis]